VGVGTPVVWGIIVHFSLIEILIRTAMCLSWTVVLWFGCRAILTRVDVILPWNEKPVIRLFADILLVGVYTFLANCFFFAMGYLLSIPIKYYDSTFWMSYLYSFIISLIISFIHEGIYFFMLWKFALIRTQSLENENLISQFETLKNQVNPHFLFNTFNTLISVIEEDKDQAIEYVQRLSDFFRSILQLRDKTVISVREELELIRNFCFIQKKRYGDNLLVEIKIGETCLDTGIAPLTLQMLVENAIKHNVISTERPLSISISERDTDYIVVRNNLQKRNNPEHGSGLGLENIKKRYHFLSEKNVEVIVSPGNFTVAIPVLHKL
ncbi:MAG: histidine kinase, partial [Bacteroidetes bacterium]|nr:histidine kinase [Bacteroidota bacterium]